MQERGVEVIRKSGYELAVEACQSFRSEMIQFLEEGNPKLPNQNIKRWKKRREWWIDGYGEDHIISMFPENISFNPKMSERTINFLGKFGIIYKEQLFSADMEEIKKYRGYGEKTDKLISLMKNVVVAEQYVEYNTP